ncbi:hypothetical protein LT85_3861 [Collimonas arenae]|uniref:Uncharacterized protein n=1 Tax=Collimonas arenae TaxID=279058 RepID=A0A0A1FHA0_9BURK|nr:hypothetical protein [Collimonas arenae]AIY43019.1 hypothetical protein LT85_3861 [Collimonas arenae]
MIKADQARLVAVHDRVTFDSDEGIQAGYVNGMRRDVGNGEMHAWVEIDHQWPGVFRAVPVAAILTSEHVGPPSTAWFAIDWVDGCVPVIATLSV